MSLKKYKSTIILSLGLLVLFFGLINNRKGGNSNRPIRQSELISVAGTLQSKPEQGNTKSSVYVHIKLKEYPDFIFSIGSIHYGALKSKSFISDFEQEDSIYLDVLTHDVETKLQKIKKISVSERLINYKFIQVFSVSGKNKTYMQLKDVNLEIEDNRALGFLFFSFGAFIFSVFAVLHWTGLLRRFGIWWKRIQSSR